MSDLDRLQGRWRQVASSVDGGAEHASLAVDEFAGAMISEFSASAFRVLDAAGAVVLEGRFVLDEAAHAIDWIDSIGPDAGKPLPAIYELSATTFAFAAVDTGMPRPTRVAAAPGVTLRRFVRITAA